jgi:hypothetical protein
MNNWGERLNARVRAYNKVNARAITLHRELVEIFRPFVGKKILTNAGFVAKLRPLLDAVRVRESEPSRGRFQFITHSTSYSLTFSLKVWESYQGEEHGGSYAEAVIHVGELGRLGATNGEHCDVPRDALASLIEQPPNLRADYNAEEVRELRAKAQVLADQARQAESALYPFGKYDN